MLIDHIVNTLKNSEGNLSITLLNILKNQRYDACTKISITIIHYRDILQNLRECWGGSIHRWTGAMARPTLFESAARIFIFRCELRDSFSSFVLTFVRLCSNLCPASYPIWSGVGFVVKKYNICRCKTTC